MEKSEKIRLIANILLIGFFISVVFYYILGTYLHIPFPYNTFLFDPNFAFQDLYTPILFSENLAPFSQPSPMINYFPLAYILLFPIAALKNNALEIIIFISTFLILFLSLNIKALKCKNITFSENFSNIFIISFMSFPLLNLIDRGNLDMLLVLFFALFVYLFKKEKYILSAFILAVINAIKPFMILFLFLFLFKRKFKEFFFCIFIMTFFIIGGFLVLKGDFFSNISVFIQNVNSVKEFIFHDNINHAVFLGSTNLFLAIIFILLSFGASSIVFSRGLIISYNIISLIITGIVLFFVYKEKEFWKKINLLTLLMLLLPYISNDYKLIFLFVPLWLFVNSKQHSSFDKIYCWLFGLLLISKKFIILPFLGMHHLAVIANPLLIILFIVLLIFEQTKTIQENKNES